MWEIWKIRCKIKFGEERFDTTQLVRKVYTHLQDINRIHQPKRKTTTIEKICLEYLDLEVRGVVEKKGKWLSWKKPEQDMFKLNVDGACKGTLLPAVEWWETDVVNLFVDKLRRMNHLM